MPAVMQAVYPAEMVAGTSPLPRRRARARIMDECEVTVGKRRDVYFDDGCACRQAITNPLKTAGRMAVAVSGA